MPGFDQTGPQGAGPMTGGRRGRCVDPEYRGRYPVQGYGVGRGGRPYGGGRGYLYGGGRGRHGRDYWDAPVQSASYPVPSYPTGVSLAETVCTILDRLNELAENISHLRGKTAAAEQRSKTTSGAGE